MDFYRAIVGIRDSDAVMINGAGVESNAMNRRGNRNGNRKIILRENGVRAKTRKKSREKTKQAKFMKRFQNIPPKLLYILYMRG